MTVMMAVAEGLLIANLLPQNEHQTEIALFPLKAELA